MPRFIFSANCPSPALLATSKSILKSTVSPTKQPEPPKLNLLVDVFQIDVLPGSLYVELVFEPKPLLVSTYSVSARVNAIGALAVAVSFTSSQPCVKAFLNEPEPAPLETNTLLTAAAAAPLGSWR
jgi:hypothetical protein